MISPPADTLHTFSLPTPWLSLVSPPPPLPHTYPDGGLSVWVRVPGELRFKLGCVATLLPPPLLRSSGPQVGLCVCLCVGVTSGVSQYSEVDGCW